MCKCGQPHEHGIGTTAVYAFCLGGKLWLLATKLRTGGMVRWASGFYKLLHGRKPQLLPLFIAD